MRVLVFDSGIGGLGVAAAVRRTLPGVALSYLMDDAGFPYGGRSDADLVARVLAVVGAGLAALQPDLVVIACNTASTVALAALRAAYAVPFVGCVPPLKSAAAASRSRVVGVLATPATVRGPYLQALAARVAPDCRVVVQGAAGLAALAEARFAGHAVAMDAVRAELGSLRDAPLLDAVALGCTHYALLLPELHACLPHVQWHDPALPVAAQVARVAATLAGTPAGQDGVVMRTGAGATLEGAGWAACGLTRAVRLATGGLPLQA